MKYEWRNVKTGKVVDHDHFSEPPNRKGKWARVFSFGLGSVQGAGNSKARQSTKHR